MKIALLCDSQQKLGGGFTFLRNLAKGLKGLGHQIVDSPLEAQIAVVSGVTMVSRDTVRAVKERGIKLVTRVDNCPRDSRNRNTGTSRLKDFTEWADAVVYQCKWAKDYLDSFIGREGMIIYNGVDMDVFKPEGAKYSNRFTEESSLVYLYSRFNRDENKRYEEAWYEYQMIQRENPKAGLIIVGKFSPENEKYGFDFFQNERYVYLPTIDNPEIMASVYRASDYLLATYFCDCFSNTYLEFLATKNENKLYKPSMTGGTPEMIDLWEKHGREFFTLERMARDYEGLFERLLKGKVAS